jgi:hypothetical protein
MDKEVLRMVNKILNEEISTKIENVKKQLNEEKSTCTECGGKIMEGECTECGYTESEVTEKLVGKQRKLDKNKNNRLDKEDFKLLRKEKMNKKTDIKETYVLTLENKTFKFNEDEIVDIIEEIVLEEKNKSIKNVTKDSQSKSKKENDEYIDSVVKKMKNYLKGGSKGEYNMEPKNFPKGNGELEKMDKMAYVPSNAVEEYVDNFTAAGLENLDYDTIHPNEKWMEDNLVGSSRTGNNPEWANAVETEVGEKRNKIRKDNLLSKIKRKAYNKSPQPVNDVTGNETDKASKILMNVESTEKKEVITEIEKMKNLIGYNQKTQ